MTDLILLNNYLLLFLNQEGAPPQARILCSKYFMYEFMVTTENIKQRKNHRPNANKLANKSFIIQLSLALWENAQQYRLFFFSFKDINIKVNWQGTAPWQSIWRPSKLELESPHVLPPFFSSQLSNTLLTLENPSSYFSTLPIPTTKQTVS